MNEFESKGLQSTQGVSDAHAAFLPLPVLAACLIILKVARHAAIMYPFSLPPYLGLAG